MKQFNTRRAAPGARFSYWSAKSLVLGLVLAAATKRTVSDYAAEKLWQPLGAEADATWIIDATGRKSRFAYVNAVLRDWGRLGLMLANRGKWQGSGRSRGLAHSVGRQCASDGITPCQVRLSNLVFPETPGDSRFEAFGDKCACRSGPEACSRADRAQRWPG